MEEDERELNKDNSYEICSQFKKLYLYLTHVYSLSDDVVDGIIFSLFTNTFLKSLHGLIFLDFGNPTLKVFSI